MGERGPLAPHARHVDRDDPASFTYYLAHFARDELFQARAAQAVSLSTADPQFREDILFSVAWTHSARLAWPDHQPPEVFHEIRRHCSAAAKSLLLAADVMASAPANLFQYFDRDYVNGLRDQATALQNFGEDWGGVGDSNARLLKEIGVYPRSGPRPMIAFTGLTALLAMTYERCLGKLPGISLYHHPEKHFGGPFIRLIDEAIDAIERLDSMLEYEDPARFVGPGSASSYAAGRRIERVLRALEEEALILPKTTEERHIRSLQDLLSALGLVDYPD